MKLKVVNSDGNKLSLFNIIYRETVGRFISSFLCVGYILIFIDKEKTAIHDKLCDSRVIYGCNVKKTVMVRKQYVPQPQVPPNFYGQPEYMVNQPMQNQPMPNRPIPNQPMQNQPIPNQPMQNQPMPNRPMPNQTEQNQQDENQSESNQTGQDQQNI